MHPPAQNPQGLAVSQSASAGDVFVEILPWAIVLVVVVLLGWVAISLINRWMRTGGGTSHHSFSLQDLRELHASGELSDEEFARAKSLIIQRTKSPASAVGRADTRTSSSGPATPEKPPAPPGDGS
jgi:hypothetical protein